MGLKGPQKPTFGKKKPYQSCFVLKFKKVMGFIFIEKTEIKSKTE